MKPIIIFIFIILCLSINPLGHAQTIIDTQIETRRLDKIHHKIINDYPQLTHVSSEEMQNLIKSQDVLLLDTREPDEYAVSHIDGAVRIDPNIQTDDFMSQFDEQIRGKTIILYCSVGRRSSKLAARLQPALRAAGANTISNLEGGIFRWHNDELPLSRGENATEKVHPYNRWWSRLVARKDDIAYAPE